MTGTAQEDIDLLRGAMDGPVIGPADADYDDARKVMNAAIDRRPAVIARCLSATEVSAAIKFARERRWEVSVRGGAHSTAGHGVCDDGLTIDLSQIRHVSVDPQKRIASRRATDQQSTTVWPESKPFTTQKTCFTKTPTSRLRRPQLDQARIQDLGCRSGMSTPRRCHVSLAAPWPSACVRRSSGADTCPRHRRSAEPQQSDSSAGTLQRAAQEV